MEKYLTILIDTLDKKTIILDKIMELVDGQEKALTSDALDIDEYNRLMELKGGLIDKMDMLDDGFTALYARVSEAMREDPTQYATQIKRLQTQITEISDKIALLQAEEIRVQSTIDRLVKSMQPQATTVINRSEAALKYARTMNKTTTSATPIFINRKN